MKKTNLLNIFKAFGGNHGIALVYVVLLLFALLAFVGLAIDIGYKYVAWSQLQNAADSGALAGVSRLPKLPATTNKFALDNLSGARKESWRYSARNPAAQLSVFLIQSSSHSSPPSNLNNTNNADGDIVVGHWSRTGGFTLPDGTTAINAVKITTRRVSKNAVADTSIGNNPLPTFFGKVLGVNELSAEAVAIAAAPPGATNYILMCSTYNVTGTGLGLECSSACTYPNICSITPRILDKGAGTPYEKAFAWTSLAKQNTPNSYLNDMICGRIFPNDDVCGVPIYTTGGQTSSVKALESAMHDPHFDTANKEFNADGTIKAWWIIIPLATECPPRDQPDPYSVERFALIRLIQVCGSGGGNACKDNNYTTKNCPYGQNNVMVMDRYSCMSCAQKDLFIGLKWSLVK